MHFTCGNIVRRENELNINLARTQGLTEEFYTVEQLNYEYLSKPDESFDVIYFNDTLMHCNDRPALMTKLSKMLAKGGLLDFTDIMERKEAGFDVLEPIHKRLRINDLAATDFY